MNLDTPITQDSGTFGECSRNFPTSTPVTFFGEYPPGLSCSDQIYVLFSKSPTAVKFAAFISVHYNDTMCQRSIVLPKLTYGLPIYPSSIPELTTVQNFLQRCFKRKYILYQIDIYDVLEEVDCSLFKKISSMPARLPSVPFRPQFKRKKVQRASEFLAVNSLGIIPSVLKIVFSIGYFSNIEELFNVMWILNVKFNAST